MILDHTPQFAGDYVQGGGAAYMRALIERAEIVLNGLNLEIEKRGDYRL